MWDHLGVRTFILFVSICASQSFAQTEIGVVVGYGTYRNGTIFSDTGKATAGIRNRFVLGATITEDATDHLSGQFRYTYHDGDPFIAARGIQTNLQGQSHSFNYNLLVHLRARDRKVRPYVAAGAGAKVFIIRGPGNPSQPLSDIGTLTTKDDAKFLATFGGGVQIKIQRHVAIRGDFLDYLTPFPKMQIKPAPFGTARGILQQFTPTFGIGYVF